MPAGLFKLMTLTIFTLQYVVCVCVCASVYTILKLLLCIVSLSLYLSRRKAAVIYIMSAVNSNHRFKSASEMTQNDAKVLKNASSSLFFSTCASRTTWGIKNETVTKNRGTEQRLHCCNNSTRRSILFFPFFLLLSFSSLCAYAYSSRLSI